MTRKKKIIRKGVMSVRLSFTDIKLIEKVCESKKISISTFMRYSVDNIMHEISKHDHKLKKIAKEYIE